MLDNAPLWQLLGSRIPFDNLDHAIEGGKLSAISVTAMGYTSGEAVSFFQGEPSLQGWKRYRRVGVPTRLKLEHLLASSAIPTIDPAVRMNRDSLGGGALRQFAPIA